MLRRGRREGGREGRGNTERGRRRSMCVGGRKKGSEGEKKNVYI